MWPRPGTHARTARAAAAPDAAARGSGARSAGEVAEARASDLRIAQLGWSDGLVVGLFRGFLALFAGISRSGITMVGSLWRGLGYEDAARFAFLLATPVILRRRPQVADARGLRR